MPTAQNSYFYETANGHGLDRDPLKAIIAPRPIGWISTVSANGIANLSPYSFFNQFSDDPAIIGFSSMTRKDSLRNIEDTGAFIFNMATRSLASSMNISSGAYPPEIDEFEVAGLQKENGRLVDVPRVALSPASLECRVTQIIQLQNLEGMTIDRWLVLGQVVAVWIDSACLVEGRFATAQAEPLLRGGYAGDYWSIGDAGYIDIRRPRTGSSR